MARSLSKCPVCRRYEEHQYFAMNTEPVLRQFKLCKFCRLTATEALSIYSLNAEQYKEVEKELGISYPTVKNRHKDAACALGYK